MEKFILSPSERKFVLILSLVIAIIAIFIGLFRLQVVEHKKLYKQSENNRIRVMPIVPHRGKIFDRNGNVLVDNRPSYSVSVVLVEEVKGVTLEKLSKIIFLDTIEIRKRIKRNLVSKFQPALVKRDVPFETIAVLEEQGGSFPGVIYQLELVRQYKSGIGGEVFTGYVGEVSPDELKNKDRGNYRPGSLIGKRGIEKQYDGVLRGEEGTEYIEVAASGQIIGQIKTSEVVPAKAGTDLYLTIDSRLQEFVIASLDTFCCGTIVAMDPNNGEILALLSFPGYDANMFSSVIPESLWNDIMNDSTLPLLNRPLSGEYPPASTAKFVTLGAGLEEGIVNANTTLRSCVGGYQFGNRFFRCWNAGGHGIINGVKALEVSCDTYFYQLGIKLGVDGLSKYYDLCGFGKVSGVDLPSETKGLNPNTAYYNERFGEKKWSRGVVLNLSIGQGELLVNILQLAQFFSGLANDGVAYKPHMIKKMVNAEGKEVISEPQVAFNLPFSDNTMKLLLEGLRRVVEGKNGTARSLKNKYYTVGGKTGTAENPHGENHSWFVGVAPLENPQIVIAAIIENGGHGSEVAAPMIHRILDKYFDVPVDSLDTKPLSKVTSEEIN